MTYNLRRPCAKCPFRNDIEPYLHPQRMQEILDGEGTFFCHETVDYSDEEERTTKDSQACAGVLIIREKMEQPNQLMRIAERLKMYDHTKLDMSAPVYDSIDEAVAACYRHREKAS